MKALFAALLTWAIAMTATPAAARDWNRAVMETPAGGYLIGNPAAPVKVVEYFSLTCSHCRHFAQTGIAPLRANFIAKGKVSLELRNFVLNGPDLSASILMRCGTPTQAVRLFHAAYAEQDKLFAGASTLSPDAVARIEAAPSDRKAAIFAREAAIDTWFVGHGLEAKQADKCLIDTKRQQQLVEMRKEATEKQDVQSTPTFIVDGKKVDGGQWDDLEAAIKMALGG